MRRQHQHSRTHSSKPSQYQAVLNKIRELEEQANDLRTHAQQLEADRWTLSVQQGVLASCCDLLHRLRSGSAHKGWLSCQHSWPTVDLTLLQDLGIQDPDNHTPLVIQLQRLQIHQQQQQQQKQSQQVETWNASDHGNTNHGIQQLQSSVAPPMSPPSSSTASQHRAAAAVGPPAPAACCQFNSQAGTPEQPSPTGMQTVEDPGLQLEVAAAAAGSAAAPSAHIDAANCHPAPMPPQSRAAPGDFLGVLNHALSQPPYPDAARLTLEQFVQYYSQYVQEQALGLALAEQQPPQYSWPQGPHPDVASSSSSPGSRRAAAAQQPANSSSSSSQHPLQCLQEAQLRHAHMVVSLVMLHSGDLLHRLRVSDLSTLQVVDEPEQAWQRMCWLADRLELREEQQQTIVAGCSLFNRLISSALSARQELLQQQGQQAGRRFPNGRAVDLEAEVAMQQMVKVLMRKEVFLVMCSSAFIMGCLDVVQTAKAAVLMWRFHPQMNMLGPILVERAQAKAKDLRQQQQQQRSVK